MFNTSFLKMASTVALLIAAPAIIGSTGQTNDFADRVLAAHNRERSNLGVQPLRWEPALAVTAQAWADHLAATGGFEHAPENHVEPEGENLWAGSKGRFSIEAMVDGWVREKRYFRSGTFPNNSTTGVVGDVGHYTQLIWRGTGKVGCALATGAREQVLVCRYSDAGNYIGESPL